MQATARRVVQSDHSHGSPGDSHVRGMERLVLVVEELSLARNLAAVQKIVRKAARDMTVADGATFVLRDEGHCYYADEDAIEPLWKGKRFPMGICISGWVMLNSQPVAIGHLFRRAYSRGCVPADVREKPGYGADPDRLSNRRHWHLLGQTPPGDMRRNEAPESACQYDGCLP